MPKQVWHAVCRQCDFEEVGALHTLNEPMTEHSRGTGHETHYKQIGELDCDTFETLFGGATA